MPAFEKYALDILYTRIHSRLMAWTSDRPSDHCSARSTLLLSELEVASLSKNWQSTRPASLIRFPSVSVFVGKNLSQDHSNCGNNCINRNVEPIKIMIMCHVLAGNLAALKECLSNALSTPLPNGTTFDSSGTPSPDKF